MASIPDYLDKTEARPALSDLAQPDNDPGGPARWLLRHHMDEFARGRGVVRVPELRGQMRVIPGTHFHLVPEMFVQVSGSTLFRFPGGRMRLLPGEICIVPRGVPHGETAAPHDGAPFLNAVFISRVPDIGFHFARGGGAAGGPVGMNVRFFPSTHAARLVGYLDDATEFAHAGTPQGATALRGVMTALLATLLTALRGGSAADAGRGEPFKVAQARNHVMVNFGNPDLCVSGIASWLGCTPDHLSALFRRTTGRTLTGFINEQRLDHARRLLEVSNLNVSEVAVASGFAEAGYFTRLFRRATGTTPSEYRRTNAARLRPAEAGGRTGEGDEPAGR